MVETSNQATSVQQFIPFGAIHLLQKNAKYVFDTSRAIDHENLSPTASIDLAAAHSICDDIGKRYVESWHVLVSYNQH